MSIRKKILLLFALLTSLMGVIAYSGYLAYIEIIKQHEIVDLKDEATNTATRFNQMLAQMQVQASALGGESVVRKFLAEVDAGGAQGDDADGAPGDGAQAALEAAQQRLGDVLQRPGQHFVRARLLDKEGIPRACVVRKRWQEFPANETTADRATRIDGESKGLIEFEPCDLGVALPAKAEGAAAVDEPEACIAHEGSVPLLTTIVPIKENRTRLGYVEVSSDLRYEVLDEMMSPRVVALVTDETGRVVLDAGHAEGEPPQIDQPISAYIPALGKYLEKQGPKFDFGLIKEFTPSDEPGLAAYDELFQHHFLVAQYPQSKMGSAHLNERRALGEKIEKALIEWRGDDSNRRFFQTSETLERDSRIVVCAATAAELEEARKVLERASGDELTIHDPQETETFAVHFQKVYLVPNDRTHYFGLLRACSIDEIEADVCSELMRKMFIALTLASLALAGIVLWGPHFIAAPLTKITRGAERIANKNDFQKVDVPHTHDEIERLGLAFNNMVGALSERKELKAANEQLEKAKRDLEKAQNSREQFLATVSHELRTPLTTVDGFCRRLLKTDLTERQRSDAQRILSAGERLLRLVKDILDYQKVVMGKLPLEPRNFDLAERVRDIIEDNQPRAAEKGLVLRLESCVDKLPIKGDAGRLTQVLENLIGNSLKFTKEGEIVCRLRGEKRGEVDWAVVEVQDTGRGMTPEQQRQLFQPFIKFLENSENPTGTGLGLAICRGICRASGGDVRVDPERTAVGQGATFVIELPLPAADTGEFASPITWTLSDPEFDGQVLANGGSLALIIDDDADVAELLKQFFKDHDFEVTVATTGIAGLEEAKRLRPSLITLDVQMPGLDGWQVLRLLKSEPDTADIPVVLVTIADDKQRGFALGATDYLTKPIDWNRLSALVERLGRVDGVGKVLVVEDDSGQRELLASGLRSRGCEVVEAANGRLALDALEAFVPDLILLDLIMPEMDGFQFLAALREREEFRDNDKLRDATVVVVSGKELDATDYDRLRGQVADIVAKGEASWDEIQRELARLVKLYVGHRTVTGGSAR